MDFYPYIPESYLFMNVWRRRLSYQMYRNHILVYIYSHVQKIVFFVYCFCMTFWHWIHAYLNKYNSWNKTSKHIDEKYLHSGSVEIELILMIYGISKKHTKNTPPIKKGLRKTLENDSLKASGIWWETEQPPWDVCFYITDENI